MSKTIGIITNDQRPIFQHDIITGVSQIAHAKGYEVLVDSLAEDPQNPHPLSLPVADLSGMIVIANALEEQALVDLYQHQKPISLVSHRVKNLPCPAVIQNNSDGITKLVDFVVQDCGRRKLVFIRGDMSQHDGVARERVFEQSLMQHNLILPPQHYLRGDFIPRIAVESMRQFLRTQPDFDAVIAADYPTACAVLDVLLDSGFDIPNEICVVGFGDGQEAAQKGLTTVGTDVVELGRRAGRQLMAQIAGTPIRGVTWMDTQLIERHSTVRI